MRRGPLLTAAILAGTAPAYARGAHVTATTHTSIYIDAGTADGLSAGGAFQATIDGRAVSVKVAAAASHDAVLELDGPLPAVGAVVELPPGLLPQIPVAPRPTPAVLPPWREVPGTLAQVQQLASREQPARVGAEDATVVTGELTLSAFLAADTSNGSTSWQDLALASQLQVASGAWRYDHLLEVHAVASPELFISPLQQARARFDVYLLRLQYSPVGAGYAAAIGRQPGAALGELGSVDGGTARAALGHGFDVGGFAGIRPSIDLGLALVPAAGADLGWSLARADRTRARVDVGVALDEYKGSLDRAQAAASASYSTDRYLAHADGVLDLATDADGKSSPRVSHAIGYVRGKRGRVTASVSGGYDRPFYDRVLAAALAPAPEVGPVLGPRTFVGADSSYAFARGLDLGVSARGASGDGFTSGYGAVVAGWSPREGSWRASLAPHAVVGSLVDELGASGNLGLPLARWSFDVGGSFDRVWAGGQLAWAGVGRLGGSRPFGARWRTALSLEVAAGDGPTRVFVFGLLGYRLGR